MLNETKIVQNQRIHLMLAKYSWECLFLGAWVVRDNSRNNP